MILFKDSKTGKIQNTLGLEELTGKITAQIKNINQDKLNEYLNKASNDGKTIDLVNFSILLNVI